MDPEPLPGRAASALLVKLHVDPSFRPAARGTVLTTRVSVSAPGNTAERDTSGTADITIAHDLPRPQLFPDVGGTETVTAGVRATERIDVLNVGSGPAYTSAGRPSITLANLLPGKLLGGWRASGSGWICSGTVPRCTYHRTVDVGLLAPQLTLTYTLAPARIAALGLRPGGANKLEQWSVTVDGRGASPASRATLPARILVAAPAGSRLIPQAIAQKGIDQLMPGSKTTLDIRLTNAGQAPTSGRVVLHGTVPAGVGVSSAFERGIGGTSAPWPCTATLTANDTQQLSCTAPRGVRIPADKSVDLTLPISARPDARPHDASVTLAARASNEIAEPEKTTSVPLIILPGNVGYPALTLSRAAGRASPLALTPATDGAPAPLRTGGSFTERFGVRNAGGAAIRAGGVARLEQSFGGAARVIAIRTPRGWTCGSTRPRRLTCTVRFATGLAQTASIVGPTIVLEPTRRTGAAGNWPASIRLTAPNAPKATHLPVLVSVTTATPTLRPDLKTQLVPTAGGIGRFNVRVWNDGSARTGSDVRLTLRLPAGSAVRSLGGSGWRCRAAGVGATCSSTSRLPAGEGLPLLRLTASFARRTAGKPLAILLTAHDGARAAPKGAVATAGVTPRHAVRAVIKAPSRVVFADQPIVSFSEPVTPTTTTLEGDGSGGSGAGLSYIWTQLCTTRAAARRSHACAGVTRAVRWITQPRGTVRPTSADVEFSNPAVKRLTVLVFRLTVTDGSATASSVVRIREIPPTPASKGFNLRNARPTRLPASGPASIRRRLPAAAQRLRGVKRPRARAHGRKRARSVRHAPRDTTPHDQGGGSGQSGGQLPEAFCDLVRDAANSQGSFSQSFGDVSFRLNGVKLTGSGCSADTTISFSDSSIKLSSYLEASGVSGTVSADGVALTRGSVTGPAAWHAPTFTIGSKGLSLPFGGGTNVEVDGSVSGSGLGFIPLPSGWTGTTTVDFSVSSGSTSVAVKTEGTGPARDTSPDSPRPTVSIDGTVANDGTFSLNVSLVRLVQLQGHAIDVTGHISRETPAGPLQVRLAGKLSEGFDIVPGLRLDSLSLEVAPTAESLGVSGQGTVLVTTGSGTAGVGISFRYDNPRNWSVTADGAGTAEWQPLPGLTIRPSDFHGSITATDGKYQFSLHVTPQENWSPSSSATLSGIDLSLSNVCPDTGAPCPKGASLFLDFKASANFSLPSVGSVPVEVRGVLALPTGGFSIAAKLPQAIDVGGGISIDSGEIELSRGVTTPVGTGLLADSVEPGGLRLDIAGSATLPLVGKVPSIAAAFTSRGFSVAAQLGSFSLPGSSGDGSKLGDTIVAWSSFPTSLQVRDPVTNAVSSLALPANTFKVSASFATPSWLKDALDLPSDVHARAIGSVNTSTGDFALRMEVDLGKSAYLYGDANSETSIRVATAYVEIARRGGDFSIALGGTAKLEVAGSSETSKSDVEIGMALGFSTSTQTVTGQLTLTSKKGWVDAFGVKDLTVFDLALAFSFDLKTLLPSIGFGGTAELPKASRDPLGLPSGVKTTLVANISVTNPCFGIDVTDPQQRGRDVLDLGRKGLVTAKQFNFEVAPFGCTVGQFHYDPGLSLNFDGAVAGVSVAISAHLGFSPFDVSANADIGEFVVGGVRVKETHIEFALSASGKLAVKFAGGFNVAGTDVAMSGGIEKSGTGVKIDFSGSLNKLELGSAVSIKDVLVQVNAQIGKQTTVKILAKGRIDILGSYAEGEFDLGVDNGKLTRLLARVKAHIDLGGSSGLVLDGYFNLDYAPDKPFTADGAVSVTAGSYQLANGTVSIRPGAVELTADLDLGGVFKARLAGSVYYGKVPKGTLVMGPNGTKVEAKDGDFLLSAKDVGFNFGAFSASGTVEFGRAKGQIWGNLAARVTVLGTASGNSVAVAGSFSSGGDFSLSGSASLDLVGTSASVNVSVARKSGAISVHGDATVTVLGNYVKLSGDFGVYGVKDWFRFSGVATISAGGHRLLDASFLFSSLPWEAGLYANVKIDAGSVFKASGKLTFVANGSRFYLGVYANLDLRVTQAFAVATFTNCTDSSCRDAAGTTNLDAQTIVGFGGFAISIKVRIGSDGSFRAIARSPDNGEFTARTGGLNLLVVRFYASFKYLVQLTVSSSYPYVSLIGAGEANVYGSSWDYRGWLWFGWSGWSHIIGVRASISTNPTKVCGYASVWGVRFGGCT
jgi:hypothetical protein